MMSQLPTDQNGFEKDYNECWVKLKNLFAVNKDGTQDIRTSVDTLHIIKSIDMEQELAQDNIIVFSFLPTTNIDIDVLAELIKPVVEVSDVSCTNFYKYAVINVENSYTDKDTSEKITWPYQEVVDKFQQLIEVFSEAIPLSRKSRVSHVTHKLRQLTEDRRDTCTPLDPVNIVYQPHIKSMYAIQ